MPGDIRCGSHQFHITDFADLHHIVTYQTMSTLDQFQRSLALTDAALTHDQDTFAVYIHQYAMDGDARCQLYVQPADDLCHKIGCRFFGSKDRHIVFSSHLQHIFIRFRHRCEDHTGNLFGYKILKTVFSLFRIQVHQIGVFYITDNLYTFRGKMFKISCQLKGRSVDIRKGDAYMFHVHFRRKILQVHFLNQFGQFYSLHISLSFFKNFINILSHASTDCKKSTIRNGKIDRLFVQTADSSTEPCRVLPHSPPGSPRLI